jgi:uncharacterized protein YndB with AHSA1/START domain
VNIEVAIDIAAPVERVWEAFTDLRSWRHWNSVLRCVPTAGAARLAEGARFRCSIRVFPLPTSFDVTVVDIVPYRRLVWVTRWLGIDARHRFVCSPQADGGVRMTSRERFGGRTMAVLGPLFPVWRIRQLTLALLQDLKAAAER